MEVRQQDLVQLTPSSSVDSSSSSDPPPWLNNSTANDNREKAKPSYLDTNLSLGLGGNLHIPRNELFWWEKRHDWPPGKPLLRSTIAGRFFIKVYMEGVLIGRKLDLLAHNDYDNLVSSLARMFNTNIHRPGDSASSNLPDKHHVLTYEDKDGDWMMVGDVPWEMFKCTVKRMMISRQDKC